ncbi:MAG: hypothetical protein KGJ34_01255 [Patescibacteria group bacterium]|nr:hypothetical protein [Patescibacteria group bacterium]
MIDPELKAELERLEQKIDAAYRSAEKTRKYIFWTIVVSVVVIVVPLLFLPFAVNSLLSTYSSALSF